VGLVDTALFAADVGWRLAFGIGALLGVGILLVRRNVPESPRWLFIHGREEEADRVVGQIEHEVEEDTGQELSEPDQSLVVHQRERIPFREIARTAFRKYPRRTVLGLSLFVGQAFLYNAITFDLGTLLGEFFEVGSGTIPLYIAIFAASNFLGPLILGRFFDTIGRKPMIAGSYLISSLLAAVLGVFLLGNGLTTWSFMAFIIAIFFFASAGASSAYLTVSEIFPMESRALSIAFFYAVGTAAGGITGPLLFGHLIASGNQDQVAIGFFIGAAVMSLGGIAELLFGVKAEQKQLEEVAEPLTAEGVETGGAAEGEAEKPARPSERHRSWERFRPGPGPLSSARAMGVSGPHPPVPLDTEISIIENALREKGTANQRELSRRVGGRYWGPGRFNQALRQAVSEGRAKRLSRGEYAPAEEPRPQAEAAPPA
jgi:MFS family permease